MRILVVSQYFWPENFRINDLVTRLCERGHDVTVMTGVPNYPEGEVFPDYRSNPAAYVAYGAANIIRLPMVPRGKSPLTLLLNYLSFALSGSLLGAWRLRGQHFDVIFVYGPSPVTVGLPAVFLKWLKRTPLAFWVLDLWPETLGAVGAVRSTLAMRLVGLLVSFIYNRCDLILAQSRSFVTQIRKYCREDRCVEYFPGWSEASFEVSQAEPAAEVPRDDGVFSIMFAGNIGDAHDFPAILDAAETLRSRTNIRWLIVGDGRNANWVKSEVARRSLNETFLLLGRHPMDRMPSFYRHADALLVSLRDAPIFAMTIPAKLQSYLAAGIPIIAMLNGEGAEIVRRSGAGVCCPAGDGRALALAVQELAAKSPAALKEMGARGLAVSRSEFDRETLISRLLSWFEKLTLHDPKALAARK